MNAPDRWDRVLSEGRWSPRWRVGHRRIPPPLRQWLQERDSLTRRLTARCREPVSLELLGLARERPRRDERTILGLAPGQVALVRQILLRCGARPVVYARTVIPLGSLVGGNRRLERLGSRPLAELLFGGRPAPRGAIQMARIRPCHALLERIGRHLDGNATALWARRSIFRPAGHPILVTEIFLPGLADACP